MLFPNEFAIQCSVHIVNDRVVEFITVRREKFDDYRIELVRLQFNAYFYRRNISQRNSIALDEISRARARACVCVFNEMRDVSFFESGWKSMTKKLTKIWLSNSIIEKFLPQPNGFLVGFSCLRNSSFTYCDVVGTISGYKEIIWFRSIFEEWKLYWLLHSLQTGDFIKLL